MALTVETGSGSSTADSYISTADAVTYLDKYAASASSNSFTAASASAQEIALRNATRTIDSMFALRFKGSRKLGTQALQWPRVGVVTHDNYAVESTEVPALVKNATCELAMRFIDDATGHDTSRLTPDQDQPGSILMERLKADVVETETEYAGASQQKRFKIVWDMLAPLTYSAGKVRLT
jgi:type II secretory pathway pseudopilin PulG